jgi:putative phosphoesterase
MKIAFISDIHGNFEALKSVLAKIDDEGVDKIFCLGDVVGYYSQVNECCEEIKRRNIPCVMGNHDWYIASGGFCPRSQSVNDCLKYIRKVIKPENIEWIRSFSLQLFYKDFHMLHAGWSDPIDEYLYEINEDYFDNIIGKYFVSGHTHIQVLKTFKDKSYCNPGSVGQPRDNDPRASYAIYDNGIFRLERTEYNFEKVFQLMDKAGFNDYYYGCLKNGNPRLCRLPKD